MANKPTKQDQRLLDTLLEFGGNRLADDALVYGGDKFVLPSHLESRPIADAVKFLEQYDQEQNSAYEITREFKYHRFDVANAFQVALKEIFGSAGFGREMKTMFGSYPPEYATVDIGNGQTIQVPQGNVDLPIIEARFNVGATRHRGIIVGAISATLPKKYRFHVEGIFKAIQAVLDTQSIYRGKAIDANWNAPSFLDLSRVNPEAIVYNADVERQIEANIWTPLRQAERISKLGMSLKRAVLLEGPYGTGKSETGLLTAREAVSAGWTFINVRPGQDIHAALEAARLLAPAVVFYEDLDVIGKPGQTDNEVSKLLDTFDGISSKLHPVMMVLTTNHVETLHRGLLRPGRLDAVIHIGQLEPEAIARLVSTLLPDGGVGQDLMRVAESMAGYLPAFIKEATERALRYAVARDVDGTNGIEITTEDLIDAADGLRPQWQLMNNAEEASTTPQLEAALAKIVHSSITSGKIFVNDDEVLAELGS